MSRCDPNDPDIEYIKSYYGLSEDFPLDQITTNSPSMKRLLLINKGISDFLYGDKKSQLMMISAGVEAFVRNTSKFSNTECIFRISQDGVYHIYPFMTKRVVKVGLDLFKRIVKEEKVELSEVKDEVLDGFLETISMGCFVMVAELKGKEEALVMHKHMAAINFMLN